MITTSDKWVRPARAVRSAGWRLVGGGQRLWVGLLDAR